MLTKVPFPAVALVLCASLATGLTFSTERPSRATMQADQWSLVGLGSVNITDIALDNSNSNTIYVSSSTVGVGVYKSTDGGESWQTAKTGLPSNVSVTDVAVDPTNPSILYATSEEVGTSLDGAIYKSTNAGEAWANVRNGLDFFSIAIDPKNPQVIYAIDNDSVAPCKVCKSTDGGQNWSNKSSGMTANSRYTVTVDPVDTQTVYIGTGGEGVFKSENGGESWSPMRNGMAGQAIVWAIAVDPVDNRIIYAGANSGVFRSTDKGNLWTKVSNGLISGQVRALVIDDRNHNALYAGVAQSVYMTVDAGSLWTPLNEGFPAGTSAPYVSDLAQRVGSASVLFAGTTDGLWTRSSPAVPALYSVSGHVTNANGLSIPDVAVAAQTAGGVTTDASGSYTISGLVNGTYTLTPSKSGYVFSPASRTISMPPNASQQDFIGALLPPRLKILYVPLNWEGPQDSFDAEARTQSDIFIDGVPLKDCRDRVSVETLEVASQNFAAFTCSLGDCGVSGVRTFVSDTLKISPSDYDVIVGLAESSPCAPIAGCSNGTDTIWVTHVHDSVTAHELGHIYGLEDEYCSNQAGSTDSRCNDGDSQGDGASTGDINWLDASQPSDCPADGSNDSGGSPCCNFGGKSCSTINYGVCCLGNKNSAGGRSTMSYANAPEPRGFDSHDQAHLSSLPALSCEEPSTTTNSMTEVLPEDAVQTVLDVHLRIYNNGSVEMESMTVSPGRPTSSSVLQRLSGGYLLSILNDAGSELWARPFPLYFDYTGPTVLDVDYSGINYAAAAIEFRIPYQCGMKTLKLFHAGTLIFSEALPAACMTPLPLNLLRSGSDRLLTWQHLAADIDHYEVHRSNIAYFGPNESSLLTSAVVTDDSTLGYLDTNQLGGDASLYYAVVPIGTDGFRYPASTRVGAFNFGLTPGTTR